MEHSSYHVNVQSQYSRRTAALRSYCSSTRVSHCHRPPCKETGKRTAEYTRQEAAADTAAVAAAAAAAENRKNTAGGETAAREG